MLDLTLSWDQRLQSGVLLGTVQLNSVAGGETRNSSKNLIFSYYVQETFEKQRLTEDVDQYTLIF